MADAKLVAALLRYSEVPEIPAAWAIPLGAMLTRKALAPVEIGAGLPVLARLNAAGLIEKREMAFRKDEPSVWWEITDHGVLARFKAERDGVVPPTSAETLGDICLDLQRRADWWREAQKDEQASDRLLLSIEMFKLHAADVGKLPSRDVVDEDEPAPPAPGA